MLFGFFIRRARRKALEKLKVSHGNRAARLVNLSGVSSVLAVVDTPLEKETLEAVSVIKSIVPARAVVDVAVFETGRKELAKSACVPEDGAYVFPYKDLNFSGIPSSSKVKELASVKYDMLIDLSVGSFTACYFILMSSSGFKVSTGGNDGSADLVINGPSGERLSGAYFIKSLSEYLTAMSGSEK